jgi:hypothetical protein
MKKALLIFLPLVLVFSACMTPPPPKKTQLEIREIQTRSYDTKDAKMVMKAVMHTLQDDNYIVKQANVDLGLLTAQKEVDLGNSLSPIFRYGRSEPRFPNNAITEASANISQFGDKTRVRINFQRKVLDNKGITMEVEQIDNPSFYQTFFSKVDKAVFLGTENLQ